MCVCVCVWGGGASEERGRTRVEEYGRQYLGFQLKLSTKKKSETELTASVLKNDPKHTRD